MKRILAIALCLVMALAIVACGGAKEADYKLGMGVVVSMDSSKDGKVAWEEFHAARPNLNENAFKMIDKDADGGISLEEWKAFSSGHGGAAQKPDMGSMMKAMGGKGGVPAMPSMNAIPSDDTSGTPTAPAMPLIMPPAKPEAAPAPSAAMPLIMPPKAAN